MKKLWYWMVISALMVTCRAHAGSNAVGQAHFEPERIVAFSKQVEQFAASKGARVFILGRQGRSEKKLPKGIEFTHTAIAVYSAITLSDGETVNGYAIYNLYQHADAPHRSFLKTDYPVDFFWGAYSLKAGIIIPSPAMQDKLLGLIASGDYQVLHNPRYSVIANPMNSQFQNCTEFTLDVINAAVYNTTDSEQLKVNAQAYFKPQRVHTSRLKLKLGDWFVEGVSTDDHRSRIYTATFHSIAGYMDEYELSEQAFVLGEHGQVRIL
jgi:hypothetical protein